MSLRITLSGPAVPKLRLQWEQWILYEVLGKALLGGQIWPYPRALW